MAEERIVRIPGVKYDPIPKEWEDDIIDAPHDAPRKSVWVPMGLSSGSWYISRERPIHDLVNAVLREYMESEIARQQTEGHVDQE